MSRLKYRIIWFIQDIRKIYYKIIYNIDVDVDKSSMLPDIGTGRFISIFKKGKYYDIVPTGKNEYVRLIPFQPNHGFLIEYWQDDKLKSRTSMNYSFFKKYVTGLGEKE